MYGPNRPKLRDDIPPRAYLDARLLCPGTNESGSSVSRHSHPTGVNVIVPAKVCMAVFETTSNKSDPRTMDFPLTLLFNLRKSAL